MKSAVIQKLGQVPQLREVPEPAVPEGWVLAPVRAAAIKNIDRMLAAGTHYGSARMALPAPVGIDAVVELPGGRRSYVGATAPSGAMAQYLPVDPARAFDIPEGVDDAAAAALPNVGISAWFALEYAGRIQPGQSILILGATGVTGGLAVELAKQQFSADHVVAVGRNTRRLEQLGELGADVTVGLEQDDSPHWIDTVRDIHAEHPFDLVLDYLWAEPAEQTLGMLANDDMTAAFHRTRYVQIGESAGPTVNPPAAVLRSAGVELVGQGAGSVPQQAFSRVWTEVLPALFAMLADGRVSVATQQRPLAEVEDAWAETAPSGTRTVLIP